MEGSTLTCGECKSRDVLIQYGLHKCKLSGDGVLVQFQSDSSKGLKKRVFEKKKYDVEKCRQYEHMIKKIGSSKGFGLDVDSVFLIRGDSDFIIMV